MSGQTGQLGDAMRKVRSGEKLAIPAQAYNAFIDTARFTVGIDPATVRAVVCQAARRRRIAATPVAASSCA